MQTQQRIDLLQSRQLELRAIMAKSDDHASKCIKQGPSFQDTYPEDYATYQSANEEFNANEKVLAELEATREAELREESEVGPPTQVHLNVIDIEKL